MISNKDNKKQLEQVQEDLHLTIKELGDVYEELSILYHLSQTFAGYNDTHNLFFTNKGAYQNNIKFLHGIFIT